MIDPTVFADQAFHYVIVPGGLFIATKVRNAAEERIRNIAEKAASEKAAQVVLDKAEEVAKAMHKEMIDAAVETVERLIEERLPRMLDIRDATMKAFIQESNDDLLQRINGTYVRSKEFDYKLKGIEDRVARVEK